MTWHDDPWARGAYSARSLASPMDDEELARPLGCLAFAGEHTAAGWHGLMEGRAAERAARGARGDGGGRARLAAGAGGHPESGVRITVGRSA